jgi:hypothetical protein
MHKEYLTGLVIVLDIPGDRGMIGRLRGFERSYLKVGQEVLRSTMLHQGGALWRLQMN